MERNILAYRPSDLTARWAQRVINNHYSNVIVSNVAIVSVHVGTTTRIRLSVEHNGPENLPKQWFVKLPSLAWRARMITALPRLLHTEVRFYNEAAQTVPVAVPGILAAQSKPGRGAILVLTDITESGGIAGNPDDTLTVEQAELVVKQLARFHAHFWDKADLARTYYWLAGPVRRLEDYLGTALAVPLMKRGLRQAGKLIPPPLHAPAVHYARHRRRVMHFLSNTSQTLVHHDCHPGNLFWSQSQPGLLDWQLVRIGEGIGDIAYFLATALDPKIRRLHEANLLAMYVKALWDHGITGIDPRNLLQRYRAHLTYPFEAMVVSLAVGGMMKLESNHELIRRTAAAVEDLDAFSAIPI
ncbi:aminoglycoside phosphotransferase [Nitrosospira sp. NpAV]|nr:aminoglycoside phosphotransferase [Nitrosospira sp. NpAV]